MGKKVTTKFMKFESLREFAKWIENTPVHASFKDHCTSQETGYWRLNFTGTETYEAANELMLNGWDFGAKEVEKIMLERATEFEHASRLMLDYTGALPCVSAYLSGSPANMIAIKKRPIRKPVITICYSSVASYDVSADQIKFNAAKLLNVIRGLESCGCGVNLYVGSFVQSTKHCCYKYAHVSKIKDSKEPFNVLNMTYPLVHPSFLRRHTLAFCERSGLNRSEFKSYGRGISDRDEMINITIELGLKKPVCIRYSDLEHNSESGITELINRLSN